ncbi:MAG: Type secretion outerrane pore forming protein YscC [Herminiimonas sp.]|nr:Type secretion outerrane pore forming protein YscC [Herminiimonas sp.]
MNFRSYGRKACCLILAAAMALPAWPATPPWPDASFTYLADNQKLTEVLTRFATSFGLEIQLTDAVRASDVGVTGKITTVNPGEFMNQIGAAYGLTWFTQNGMLYVSKSNERSTQAIVPPGISAASLKRALTELGVIESKFGWGEIPDRGIALVSGPPSYVRLVARVVADLPVMVSDQQLQVFKLKHAPVDDRTMFFRDKQIVTAGVASILRGLISGESSKSGTSVLLVETAAPLRSALPALGSPEYDAARPGERAEIVRGGGAPPTVAPGSPGPGVQPVIQADSRLNAVIIRDRPERMQIYKELITLLDVPSQLVEIEAMIVDVNSSHVSQLGIDWSGRAGNVSANVTAGGALNPANTTAVINIAKGSSTVIADAANFLLARINVLEGKGAARIVSRPSILTMDNLGALIDLSETFYIQSVGERVASVVPISVGVTLKVTPHIIDEGGTRSVQLVVDIEDGTIEDRQIQSLPTVRRSTIGTQAVMGERESLLIGGFNSEQNIRQKDGVPGLGNLPFVGAFFAKSTTNVERRERLFLITPKIVSLGTRIAPNLLQQAPLPQGAAATQPIVIGPASVPLQQRAPTPVPPPQGPPVEPAPWQEQPLDQRPAAPQTQQRRSSQQPLLQQSRPQQSQQPLPPQPIPQEPVPQEPVPQEPVPQEPVPQEPVPPQPLQLQPLQINYRSPPVKYVPFATPALIINNT